MDDFIRAKDIMSKRVNVVDSDDTILKAVETMYHNSTDFVIVMEKNQAKGIFLEKNLPGLLIEKISVEENIKKVMDSPLIFVEKESSLFQIFNLFKNKNLKKLPVINNGIVVGMIHAEDLTKGVLEINKIIRKHLRFEEKTTERIDQIFQKIIKSCHHAKDISESLRDMPEDQPLEFMNEYISKRTERIMILIETIVNLAILADEIDIEDKNKTEELDKKIEKELNAALENIEEAKNEIINNQ
ncbi:CBS domain-containing protein [Candidatus Woesearchaeota archaeon]|nr:CBS domain-containing protein [Candidatus Woesearchaeota archaeon]